MSFFVVFLVFARSYDIGIYGRIVSLFAFANILHSFFELGLPFYFQREAAKDIKKAVWELSPVLKLRGILFLLFLPTALFFPIGTGGFHSVEMAAISTAIYLYGIGSLINSILYGRKEYKSSFFALLASRIVLLALSATMLIMPIPLVISLFVLVFSACVHIVFVWRKISIWNNGIDAGGRPANVLPRILRSSTPIGAGIIFVWLYDRADVLLISHYLNFENVALYSVAYSLYKLSQVFSSVVILPAYTVFSGRYHQSGFLRKTDIRDNVLSLFMLSGICIGVFHLFGRHIITLLYGEKFLAAAGLLRLLSFAIPGLLLNNLTGIISNTISREKIPLIATGAGAALNIILNVFLILTMGLTGAVIATIATELFVFLMQYLMLARVQSKMAFVK